MNYSFMTAGRIVAGIGSCESIPELLAGQGFRRAVIVTDPGVFKTGLVDEPKKLIESANISVDVLAEVAVEPPIEIVDTLWNRIKDGNYDLIVGFGGGSSLDLAKLLSVKATNTEPTEELVGTDKVKNPGVPTLLIPTTAGTGSEATPNAIVTLVQQELKVGIVSRHLLPRFVVVDPLLTLGLPKPITAATGMDAMIHSVESFISKKANPISDGIALYSIGLISRSIQRAYHHGDDLDARHDMMIGALFGGMALTSSGTAAVHALAYPLGGKYGISHGVSNSMLFAPVMEYNFSAIIDRLSDIAGAMGLNVAGRTAQSRAQLALDRINELVSDLQIPTSLIPFGVKPEDLEYLAVSASKVTRLLNNNPKEMPIDEIRKVYQRLLV